MAPVTPILAGRSIVPTPRVPALATSSKDPDALELSTATLSSFLQNGQSTSDHSIPSGRRRVMVIRDSDVILAAGKTIRMSSLSDAKAESSSANSHIAPITFDIHQIALNPSGKLLAVAGKHSVAVVILPRSGFARRGKDSVDCKSMQVGEYYHGSSSAPPVAKIEWHPWGEAGSTLLIMTVDGKLREYDVSADSEEPQQTVAFLPERKKMSVSVEDPAEREVASFSLGRGKADWGPLTVYTVMRSGDVYAVCPYMPKNATVPSAYVHSLDCFVAAKKEYLAKEATSSSTHTSAIYDYQQKFVSALLRQLPQGTVFPAVSRPVSMHPPSTIKSAPVVQGPFLLQPAPRMLDDSDSGDATDIIHTSFTSSTASEDIVDNTERLGVVLISYQDGRVDVCLDVEKVEAKWDIKHGKKSGLPMLAVYETIDLGLVKTLKDVSPEGGQSLLDLLQANHIALEPDPIYDDMVYAYHAFGVHALDLGDMLGSLMKALHRDVDDDETLAKAVNDSPGTAVQPIVTTFSTERKCSNPVVAVAVPSDVYLTYSLFVLTSAGRLVSFPLTLQTAPSFSPPLFTPTSPTSGHANTTSLPTSNPPAYISTLGTEPWNPPSIITRVGAGLPSSPRLVLPQAPDKAKGTMITPESLRYLGAVIERFNSHIHAVSTAQREAEVRSEIQEKEFTRQQLTCAKLMETLEKIKSARLARTTQRVEAVKASQTQLLGKMDRILKGLMLKASPSLSEHETKWFQELNRMKEEIVGAGRYDEESLSARTRILKRDFDKLRPSLEDVQRKDEERRRQFSDTDEVLGSSQAAELVRRTTKEQRKIQKLVGEVEKLALGLDVPLDQGPFSK